MIIRKIRQRHEFSTRMQSNFIIDVRSPYVDHTRYWFIVCNMEYDER